MNKIAASGALRKPFLTPSMNSLNNTVVAPPRMLIAFLENNLQSDGTVRIPAPLRPDMGFKETIG